MERVSMNKRIVCEARSEQERDGVQQKSPLISKCVKPVNDIIQFPTEQNNLIKSV